MTHLPPRSQDERADLARTTLARINKLHRVAHNKPLATIGTQTLAELIDMATRLTWDLQQLRDTISKRDTTP